MVRYWVREPRLSEHPDPQLPVTHYMLAAQRNDGIRFAATVSMSGTSVGLTKDVRGMAFEVLRQLTWSLDTYLDPACTCGTKEEKWCRVRHPGENKDAESEGRTRLSAV